MTVKEAVLIINHRREKLCLSPISITERASYSAPGKKTMEVWGGSLLLTKSTHWGVIHSFLKGMLSAFSDKPVVIETPVDYKRGRRVDF